MMKRMLIKVESFEEMLIWSDALAQAVDDRKEIPESCIRSFEDAEDLHALFTPSRRQLLSEVLNCPVSIEELALRLRRGVCEVERDVRLLVEEEILVFEHNLVTPISESIEFEPTQQPVGA